MNDSDALRDPSGRSPATRGVDGESQREASELAEGDLEHVVGGLARPWIHPTSLGESELSLTNP